MKYILEKHESKVLQSIDAIDSFLAGMMPISKSLSPYYLNLIETQIFSVVQRYELKIYIYL